MNSLIATALIGCLAGSSLLTAGPATASTALFQAIRAGDRAEVETLLKNGADLHARDERVHQLPGLAWAGEKAGALKKFVEAVQQEQRADGGWGQLAGLDSDAYATGQSLYALMEGGKVAASDPAVRRGIDFLLRTQLADGTWHVRTRAHPFQPPMDSGFPHGRDGWISAAGTSWAVMALATSLDPTQVPPTTPVVAKVATLVTAVAAPVTDDTAVWPEGVTLRASGK